MTIWAVMAWRMLTTLRLLLLRNRAACGIECNVQCSEKQSHCLEIALSGTIWITVCRNGPRGRAMHKHAHVFRRGYGCSIYI